MMTYRELLDGAYEHFEVRNMRQVWGIAIGVFIGWLVVSLPRSVKEALR